MKHVLLATKSVTSYKNETKTEVSARVDASYEFKTTVHVKVRYTIYRP